MGSPMPHQSIRSVPCRPHQNMKSPEGHQCIHGPLLPAHTCQDLPCQSHTRHTSSTPFIPSPCSLEEHYRTAGTSLQRVEAQLSNAEAAKCDALRQLAAASERCGRLEEQLATGAEAAGAARKAQLEQAEERLAAAQAGLKVRIRFVTGERGKGAGATWENGRQLATGGIDNAHLCFPHVGDLAQMHLTAAAARAGCRGRA
eukprot:366280-Chlamydomonas_euryale.AAC.2